VNITVLICTFAFHLMKLIHEIKHLIHKEFLLEFRQKYAFAGVLLYVFSTVFICYLSFKKILVPANWNALFWIIVLFAAINAIAKSFLQESKGRQLYYYTLHSPVAVIVSKIIYNSILMLAISFLCFFCYGLLIKNNVQDIPFFILNIALGSLGFASVLTMVSAIASKTNNNFSLMAILSFPMLVPMLITLIKTSKYSVDGLDRSLSYSYFGVLLLINVLIIVLSVVLFPYLWRE